MSWFPTDDHLAGHAVAGLYQPDPIWFSLLDIDLGWAVFTNFYLPADLQYDSL